jgi:CheY-like chemotaxis protein
MAQLSQLLLFDPDPSGLETLAYVFQKDGCAVSATGDVAKARELIENANQSLVLVALRDPEQVGLDLIRATTSNPRTRNLACVAIGRSELRAAALGAGAFGFLSSPLFVRDALDACKLVAAATVPGSRPSPDTEVALKLAEVGGLYYLVRALAVTGRSAAAEVQQGQRKGELRFSDGVLSSAQLGSVQGLPALHHLLLWEDAELRIKFRNVVRRGGQLSLKGDEIIEECDRFLRDFAHEAKELGVARTVYLADPERARPTAALPSEVVPVLRLFDGKRDLAQVLDESPFRVFDTLKIVKQFAAAEAIRPTQPLPPGLKDAALLTGGAGALDIWFQRQAVVPESPAAAAQTAGAGAQTAASAVPSDSGAVNRVGTAARKRTITQREIAFIARAPERGGAPPPVANAVGATTPPPKTVAAVATVRGEIQVSPAASGASEKPTTNRPSIMIEIEPLPAPVPLAPATPAPLTARTAPPSVIVSPMTPPPTTVARPRNHTPGPRRSDAGRGGRTPPSSFSAVEADFFEREADLYKGEKIESFEDLDGTPRPVGTGTGSPRKR